MAFAASILVPTDLSPSSYEALAEAARLATIDGARVRLLHVFDVSPFRLFPQDAPLSPSTLRRIAEEANGAAQSVLLALKLRFFQGLPAVEVVTAEHEGVAGGICASAREAAADLIVMASHGRDGRASTAHGSVTAKVVRSAPCRVLVVPSGAAESQTH